ncbi:hypothetical protein DL98DRAFT_251230 [Cadophora sp. DSE1049]|nr:hypothetical protein DL98DRAFT_251230 [Cadophora sp. DSE1049]
MEERHRSVHNNQAMIQTIAHKAQSLRELYPKVKVAQSLLDAPSDSGSILGDTRTSIISDREFEFDDLVVNSQAYRRALKAAKRDLRKGGHQRDEGDLIDLGEGTADPVERNVEAAEAKKAQKTAQNSSERSEAKHNNSTNASSMTVDPEASSTKPGQASRSIVQGWADEYRTREEKNTNGPSVPSASAIARGGQPTTTENKPKDFYPHAFERWETLSAHWEGFTSFWIRRLEENTAEFRRDPSSEQLAGQVKDLSAAGKNLFDAVVELQRLRASSERKFQRWFFDTRADQERSQELVVSLEKTLQEERIQNQATLIAEKTRLTEAFERQLAHERTNLEARMSQLQQETLEQRRTMSSHKEEARRAWEELGRREQEERDRLYKMESCKPVMVGGVVLFPLKSSSWDEESEKRPLYEVSPAPKVPDPWVAQWDGKPPSTVGTVNGTDFAFSGEHDKWLFINSETRESGYTRPKPAPRPRPTNKNSYATSSKYSIAEATSSLSLTPHEDELPENALVYVSAE